MRLGVVDLLVAAFYAPLAPGGDDGHIGGKMLYRKLEADLIVALSGAAMADGVRALLESYLNETLRYAGTRRARAEQILLVKSSGLHRGDNVVINVVLGEVENVELRGSGLKRLLLKPLELVRLTDVAGNGDDLGIVVILLEPGNYYRGVKPARIGENDFLYIRFIHFSSSKFFLLCQFYAINPIMSRDFS